MAAAGECVYLAIRPLLEQGQGCVLSPGEGAQPHKAACAVHLLERKCLGCSLQPCMVPAVVSHVPVLSQAAFEPFLDKSSWPGWFCCLYCKPNIRLECSSLNSFWHISFPFTQETKSCRRVWQGHSQVLQKVSGQLFPPYTQCLAHCFAVVIGDITPVTSVEGFLGWMWPTELILMRHRGNYKLKGESLVLLWKS